MEGKKKKRRGLVLAKPDYKKAYVTLKSPLSISSELFPIRMIEEERRAMNKQSKTSIVDDGEKKKTHWLGDTVVTERRPPRGRPRSLRGDEGRGRSRGGVVERARFPWSSMKPTPAK